MIQNKKGIRNYNISDTIEAGIVLTGAEVKSIRDNRINIGNAYVKVINNELWLINADITQYKFDRTEKYDNTRTRKLLVHKKQIYELLSKSKAAGLTIVPIKLYFERGRAKVLIGLGKGRKLYENKAREKARDLDREFHREKRRLMV